MRDPRIAPKGWPTDEKKRLRDKGQNWHFDWSDRWSERVPFRPDSRVVDNSDYNLHYVDVEAPLEAEVEYGERDNEISGERPRRVVRLPLPTGAERLRGAMVSAAIGDAFAGSRGALKEYSWYCGVPGKALVDYLPIDRMLSCWITQLMGYTGEGLIRALTGRRAGHSVDPVSTVQHGYQRWLYRMLRDVRVPGEWRTYGGPYARESGDDDAPDGPLSEETEFRVQQEPDAAVIDALKAFAATGIRSTPADPRSAARGGDVLARAALAAVWSEDLSETFDLAVAIAALTHPHPDDYLAAGTLAVVLHQQIRARPFMDCLADGYRQLMARPGHERTSAMIDNVVGLVRNERAPMQPENLRRHFPGGGADATEVLGIALYSAMLGDYVREALLLALNYADAHARPVAATAGMLIGAEYGIRAVPKVFRDPVESTEIIDMLATDIATELRDVLTDDEWRRRYPPT
ncbi:ADP-ribosylglycohydrolase family protein [Nocardia sp. NEAU-G5]|uniref:ADP-ribosylglycohydrolase family protein n=1 Tax=Nocardia albiluteola TaxID=2842303 RepID=A0ABS6AXU4_9NOCA|nr:ADP-ribosylglycohydrolase family protein [Nocardia albiluteola]MBU3062867.1 ADP-ribosylglycohydrolase family protein [Nocardia albiluteola]